LSAGGIQKWDFSPGNRFICVNRGGRLIFYDAKTLQPTSEPSITVTNANRFAFSPDGRLLAASDGQGYLSVWNVGDSSLVTHFPVHSSPAFILASGFISGGRSLLTAYGSFNVKEWDVSTWKEVRRWRITDGQVLGSVCPATGLLATADGYGNFELLLTSDPERRQRNKGEDRMVSIQLSPDGQTLAAASENGTVELWNTKTLTREALLHGVLLGYHSVAISPDGERVAAGSNGQEAIKMWDLHSHEEVATLPGQGSFFSDASFSPDGNTVGARNWNDVIHFWTAPSWAQIEAAEKSRRNN
jgi:WD40 repeat protein